MEMSTFVSWLTFTQNSLYAILNKSEAVVSHCINFFYQREFLLTKAQSLLNSFVVY